MIQTRSKYELLSWEKKSLFTEVLDIFCPLSIYFFLYYSKSGDLTVSLCFIIIIAVSQQLFLLFVLSSWQTLTSASKASSFCLTVNRWNSASTSPRSSALFFSLTDNLFRSPGVLLICAQQDIWTQCEQNHSSALSESDAISNCGRSSMMFLLCGQPSAFNCLECLSSVHVSYDSQYHFIISKIVFVFFSFLLNG